VVGENIKKDAIGYGTKFFPVLMKLLLIVDLKYLFYPITRSEYMRLSDEIAKVIILSGVLKRKLRPGELYTSASYVRYLRMRSVSSVMTNGFITVICNINDQSIILPRDLPTYSIHGRNKWVMIIEYRGFESRIHEVIILITLQMMGKAVIFNNSCHNMIK
jgi:hypothetical protein